MADGSVGFAFDANAPDLGSTFLLDSSEGVSLTGFPDDMNVLRDRLPDDNSNPGNPEIVAGAWLTSEEPLEGKLAFLELSAGDASGQGNHLGLVDKEAEPHSDDPFLSGFVSLELDLGVEGGGDSLVPLLDISDLTINAALSAGYELDPTITASLGDVLSIDGELFAVFSALVLPAVPVMF